MIGVIVISSKNATRRERTTVFSRVLVPVIYVIFVEDLKLVRWETKASSGSEGRDSPGLANGSAVHP